MAVYHITLHAFGSWRADHPRGYTERHEGYQLPNPEEQQRREENLTQAVVEFDEMMQRILIVGTHDICKRRGWRFHGAGNDKTHFHAAISWRGFVDWQDVRDKLKNLLSLFLGRWRGVEGRTWFVEGGSRKRVENEEHLDHLLDTYFPGHRGVFWREGLPLPQIPQWVLTGKGKPGPGPGPSGPGYQGDPRDPPS
jgi:hypothetical protein